MPTFKRGIAGVYKIMENRRKRREVWREEARILWEKWHRDSFFTMGVALYWGEGHKAPKASLLALTNSDVTMLRVWLRWCQRFLPGVPLYFDLRVHDTCDVEAARRYWKQELGVDMNVVTQAVSRASKRIRNTLPNGTLRIKVRRGSVEWYTKMMVWLELIQDLPSVDDQRR